MELGALITQLGLPTALAIYFIIRDGKQTDKFIKMTTDMIESQNNVTAAINALTTTLKPAMERLSGGRDATQ